MHHVAFSHIAIYRGRCPQNSGYPWAARTAPASPVAGRLRIGTARLSYSQGNCRKIPITLIIASMSIN